MPNEVALLILILMTLILIIFAVRATADFVGTVLKHRSVIKAVPISSGVLFYVILISILFTALSLYTRITTIVYDKAIKEGPPPKPVIAVYLKPIDLKIKRSLSDAARTERVLLAAAQRLDAKVLVCSDWGTNKLSGSNVERLDAVPGVHLQHTLAQWLNDNRQKVHGLVLVSNMRTGAFEPATYRADSLRHEDILKIHAKLAQLARAPVIFRPSAEASTAISRFKHTGE